MSKPSSRRFDLQLGLRVLTWIALAVLVIVLVRTAWLADDAYISFRTIRNFVDGDGLRWNLSERVQAFTHPLWVFLLAAVSAASGELYYTTFAVSFGCTLACAGIMLFRIAPTRMAAFTCAVILISSRSFVDFSSSGLENPLTHLLLASFAWVFVADSQWSPRRLFRLALLAALATTNRFDVIVLVAPMLLWAWWHGRSARGTIAIAAAFAPLLLWELFSLIYFGFLFPNTAYAKLPAAIEIGSRLLNGGRYLVSCVLFDPLAILVIVVALVVPAARRRWSLVPLSAGILLYTLYVVWVGGDFMGGRFFTAPLVLALAAVSRLFPWPTRGWWLVPASVAVGLSLMLGPHSPLVAGADYGTRWHWTRNIDSRRIADERAVYHKITGLVRAEGRFRRPWHPWFEMGARVPPGAVSLAATIGFAGWAAPRDAIIIDQLGLSDAFIARLPPIKTTGWRPGHLDRAIPDGYVETRRTGQIKLTNRWLAEYYRQISLVTSGPLWSGARWRAIWDLHTGGLDHLVGHYADIELADTELSSPRDDGTPWQAPGNIVLNKDATLYVHLATPRIAVRIRLAADGNDRYQIILCRGDQVLWTGTAEAMPAIAGLANRTIEIPTNLGVIDTLRIRPSGGDGRYSVGHVGIE